MLFPFKDFISSLNQLYYANFILEFKLHFIFSVLFGLAIINFVLHWEDDDFGVVSTATDGCGHSTVFGSSGF